MWCTHTIHKPQGWEGAEVTRATSPTKEKSKPPNSPLCRWEKGGLKGRGTHVASPGSEVKAVWDLEPPSHPGDPMNQHSLQNQRPLGPTNGCTTVPPSVPGPWMLPGLSQWTPTSTQGAGLKSCWAG